MHRKGTYVCIEDLELAQDWMRKDDTCCCFSHKPITSDHVDRRTIERIWMDSRSNDWVFGENHQTRSEGAAGQPGLTVRHNNPQRVMGMFLTYKRTSSVEAALRPRSEHVRSRRTPKAPEE